MYGKRQGKKVIRILWAICVIPLIIGIILLTVSTETTEYSTDEYWVAQDYHHVYERYSGQIVNYIEDNETCKIDGDTIIVQKRGGGYLWGGIITGFFGLATLGCIWGSISTSNWWFEWQKKHNF